MIDKHYGQVRLERVVGSASARLEASLIKYIQKNRALLQVVLDMAI